jgi:signal recognition particle receptor subunit alpha
MLYSQVAYQRILQLAYVDDLLAALKTLFVKLFQPFLTSFVASLHTNSNGGTIITAQPPNWNFKEAFKGWDKVFDRVLRELEEKANQVRGVHSKGPFNTDWSVIGTTHTSEACPTWWPR